MSLLVPKTKTMLIPTTVLMAAVMLASIFMMPAFAQTETTGNGAPSGKHYTLNILGKNWDKGDYALIMDPTDPNYNPVVKDDNGHRIFVKLDGKTRIILQEAPEGESFDVIDADGTDGKAVLASRPNVRHSRR